MYISVYNNKENIINATYNNNKFNNLREDDKNSYIKGLFNYYKKTLPLVKYNEDDVKLCYNNLKSEQKYFLYEKPENIHILKKYNLNNLINFINITETKKILIKNNLKKFLNFNLVINDYDYKKNYINICSLSDFYTNKDRMSCEVLKHDIPIKYYEKNYHKILRKYFENLKKYYEYGLKINKLEFKNNDEDFKKAINTIYLQNIMYEDNKYCTVYKPYLFKLFINLFGAKKIIDLSSGWGDRLLASISKQDDIELYIGIDPNKSLFKGYNKMIEDLCEKKNKNKYFLINSGAEQVEYNNFENDIDMIFWSPPFFNIETYTKDDNQSIMVYNKYSEWEDYFLIHVINLATNKLKVNGVLVLYLGGINYKTFFNKMNNISKLKYLGDIHIYSEKIKSYIIFIKIKENGKIKLLDNKIIKDNKEVKEIKKKIKNQEINPKLTVIELELDNKKILLVQEGLLLSGTKQRVATKFIEKIQSKNKEIKTLVYAGAYNGFGAVATAYAAHKLGLKSKVFLSEMKNGMKERSLYEDIINSRQIITLQLLESDIYLCENYRTAKELEYDYSTIPTKNRENWLTKPNYYIVPMGLNDEEGIMIELLHKQIIEAIKKTAKLKIDINTYNGTIWCVSGSGGIVQALHKVFKKAKFCIYLTGGGKYYNKVLQWVNKNNITILNNNKDYYIKDIIFSNDYKKYYKSVDNYDSLIWPWVKKYSKNDDILWNVSSD